MYSFTFFVPVSFASERIPDLADATGISDLLQFHHRVRNDNRVLIASPITISSSITDSNYAIFEVTESSSSCRSSLIVRLDLIRFHICVAVFVVGSRPSHIEARLIRLFAHAAYPLTGPQVK